MNDPYDYGVIGADWGTPYAKAFTDEVKALNIHGTPYICVLWANLATAQSGYWNFHLALATAPLEPLSLDALQEKNIHLLQKGPRRWFREKGDWGSTKTLFAAPGHRIALDIGGCRHEAGAFPEAPQVDYGLEKLSEAWSVLV
ncbi:hypothetical protein MIND_00714300 [Mycena indigotica]|uniref:Uncharacterized protein n=1 Tax=Mycena indigotica TaxID=2126181 RepID=A0A8H6SLE7_9AGAR|nr:uncharacterized protein MIND_00714300 [Mycena indigotica]KAF7301489.1 hypothetical protein MIND_00714300 [Mycena indigotica]